VRLPFRALSLALSTRGTTGRRSLTYEQRLFKYAVRGFAVALPGVDLSCVDPALFKARPRPWLAAGLKKLLLLDYQVRWQRMSATAFGSRRGVQESNPVRPLLGNLSDYQNDVIPKRGSVTPARLCRVC
jgi:hypothetical protein